MDDTPERCENPCATLVPQLAVYSICAHHFTRSLRPSCNRNRPSEDFRPLDLRPGPQSHRHPPCCRATASLAARHSFASRVEALRVESLQVRGRAPSMMIFFTALKKRKTHKYAMMTHSNSIPQEKETKHIHTNTEEFLFLVCSSPNELGGLSPYVCVCVCGGRSFGFRTGSQKHGRWVILGVGLFHGMN